MRGTASSSQEAAGKHACSWQHPASGVLAQLACCIAVCWDLLTTCSCWWQHAACMHTARASTDILTSPTHVPAAAIVGPVGCLAVTLSARTYSLALALAGRHPLPLPRPTALLASALSLLTPRNFPALVYSAVTLALAGLAACEGCCACPAAGLPAPACTCLGTPALATSGKAPGQWAL